MWEKLKYASDLWNGLAFHIFMHEWDKARTISEQIDAFNNEHPIIGFFAKRFHDWL